MEILRVRFPVNRGKPFYLFGGESHSIYLGVNFPLMGVLLILPLTDTKGSANLSEFFSAPYRTATDRLTF
jgi:hypothetical protein